MPATTQARVTAILDQLARLRREEAFMRLSNASLRKMGKRAQYGRKDFALVVADAERLNDELRRLGSE